jgi:hypothetical protein
VQGDPGKLWRDEPTPWVAGGENWLGWVGRAGPKAQEDYFKRHRGALSGARIAVVAVAAAFIVASLAVVLR